MIWKVLIALAALAIIVGGVVWVSHGMEIYTKDREEVVVEKKDELFGTVTREVTYKPTFKYGFLPDDTSVTVLHRSYLFVLALAIPTIVGSVIMLRRGRK